MTSAKDLRRKNNEKHLEKYGFLTFSQSQMLSRNCVAFPSELLLQLNRWRVVFFFRFSLRRLRSVLPMLSQLKHKRKHLSFWSYRFKINDWWFECDYIRIVNVLLRASEGPTHRLKKSSPRWLPETFKHVRLWLVESILPIHSYNIRKINVSTFYGRYSSNLHIPRNQCQFGCRRYLERWG